MLDMIPPDPALVSPPRLRLTATRARRAVLDGAWWPRSWDVPEELPGLLPALSERYGRIRLLALSGSVWTNRVRRLGVAGHMVRIGWFASMSEALLVATTDGGERVDLLVVPPDSAHDWAERAMAAAADPANVEHAAELLAQTSRPVRRLPTGVAEAVWDNEGGTLRGGTMPADNRPSDVPHRAA